MKHDDEGWEALVDRWKSSSLEGESRSGTGTADARFPSNHTLEIQARSNAKRVRIETGLNLVLALLLGGYIAFDIVSGLPSMLDYVLYSGLLLLVVLVGGFAFRLQRKAWRCVGEETTSYLKFLHKQADISARMTWLGQWFAAAVVALVFGLALWIAVQMLTSGNTIAKPITASLILGFVGIFFPSMILVLRRRRRVINARRDVLASMLNSTHPNS